MQMMDISKHRKKTAKIVEKLGNRAVDLQGTSKKHFSRYLTRRTGRIGGIKRFAFGWLLLVVLLTVGTLGSLRQVRVASQAPKAVAGGVYTEGLIGTVNNLNPMFSSGMVDDSVGRMVFNGLMRYDEEGNLVPDLATQLQVDESKKIYTLTLKDDVLWHDDQPFDAEDVTFTFATIQNPATRSTAFASWQGIKVSAVDARTVRFELPAPFAPFPGALTASILPSHLLKDIPAEKIRTAAFNNGPVGTGPFVFKALRKDQAKQQQVEFARNPRYFRGEPQLDRFIMRLYEDDEALASALEAREITAAVDLKPDTAATLASDKSIRLVDIPLNSGVFAFMKNTSPLLADANVRSAMALGIDREKAVLELFDARYTPLKSPLLPSQIGYDPQYNQVTNLTEAQRLLDAAGWVKQANGMRAKDGAPLQLNLITVNSAQYSALAGELQRQWAAIGVDVKSQLLTLEQLQQNGLAAHSYDILLYGISIGYDPDVYAYWHSSQARSSGLNFSEWKSTRADVSLEVARTRLEKILREARYKTFLDEWKKSSPAVALYQPRVTYVHHQNAQGIIPVAANNASARLTNVEDWTVGIAPTQQTP